MLSQIASTCLGLESHQIIKVTERALITNHFSNRNIAYLALDTETGGTNAKTDAVCSLSVILANRQFEPLGLYHTNIRFDPDRCYSREAEKVHGISQTELDNPKLPTLDQATMEVFELAGLLTGNDVERFQLTPLGHNVRFDLDFIQPKTNHFGRMFHPHRILDTSTLAQLSNYYASLNDVYRFVFSGRGPALADWIQPVFGNPDSPDRELHHSLLDTLVCLQGCWKANQYFDL